MLASTTSNVMSMKASRAGIKTFAVKSKVKAQKFSVGLSSKQSVGEIELGFTKGNELFVGRLAMLGFAASLVGEILTAVALFNVAAALFPASGKFVPEQEDFSDRKPGSLQKPSVSLANPREFFGITRFGFTKENELFVGRAAQLGFAASIVGEALTSKGPLAQFGLETGIPISESEPLLLAFIAFTFFAAINEGTGKFVKEDK